VEGVGDLELRDRKEAGPEWPGFFSGKNDDE
jgi:hypothetical protein